MSFPCKRESRNPLAILVSLRIQLDSVTPAKAGVRSSVANMDSRRSLPPNAFIGGVHDGRQTLGEEL